MAKKKPPKAYIKLQIPAQEANPSPPVGPALGQHGLNIMAFCKDFNAVTANLEKGIVVPVVISVFDDRSFSMEVKSPPAAVLIRKAAGIDKGSGVPNLEKVGKVTIQDLEKIAAHKKEDLNTCDLGAAVKMLIGTARSMGVEVHQDS